MVSIQCLFGFASHHFHHENRIISIYVNILFMSIMNHILNHFTLPHSFTLSDSFKMFVSKVWVRKSKSCCTLESVAASFRSPKWHLSMVRWEQHSFGGPSPSVSKLSKPKAKKKNEMRELYHSSQLRKAIALKMAANP